MTEFDGQTTGLPWANAKDLGVTPYQIVIVASLIEKEVRVPEERAKVAAVIYNRLSEKMPLGIDASTRFAVNKWTGPLTKSDLEDDSPYNTRKAVGLPPGPIASPGLASLEAALEPAVVDYLYYVLQDDAGHHFFTKDYAGVPRSAEERPATVSRGIASRRAAMPQEKVQVGPNNVGRRSYGSLTFPERTLKRGTWQRIQHNPS